MMKNGSPWASHMPAWLPSAGGRTQGPWGPGWSTVAPPQYVPVCTSPPSLASQPCQGPSFGGLIRSGSLPHCICNSLFTSLCQLPLPDGALPKDRGHAMFLFASLPAPTHCLAPSGPGNCM